jgi:hypothetical protein
VKALGKQERAWLYFDIANFDMDVSAEAAADALPRSEEY